VPYWGPIIEHVFESHAGLLDRLDDAFDELLGTSLASLDAGDLLALTRRWESLTRRAGAVEHRLVAEVDQRNLAVEHGYRHTAALLHDVWNVSAATARRRVRLARDLAPGRALSGAALPPIFSQTAAAEAGGNLSIEHAQVIINAVDRLPDGVAATSDVAIEKDLVEQAAVLDPVQLSRVARRIIDHLDPDGVLRDEDYRERRRDLSVHQRPDGTVHGSFELTAACGERLLTILDSLARPLPAADGTADPRSPGQRRHDGLEDALDRLLRDGGLPNTGGVATTVLLLITEDQLRERAGLATTGHGGLISLPKALELAADANVVPVVFGRAGQVAAHGTGQRLANPSQRYALIARDKGCCFPGCDAPPAWTQAHHMIDYQLGGPTAVDNLALLCGPCHRMFDKLGWRGVMIDGVPHWIPPAWIDPNRQPRRNTMHG
jgi:hypothetical protein